VDTLRAFRDKNPLRAAELAGARWQWLAGGPPNAPALLLLHGMTGAADIWFQQIVRWRDRLRVIAVTYPELDSLERMADGVCAVLQAESVSRAHVIGSSLGGYLAQFLVAARPEVVASAVFGNTFPPGSAVQRTLLERASAQAALTDAQWRAALAAQVREHIHPAGGHSALLRAYQLEQAEGALQRRTFEARGRCAAQAFVPRDPASLGIASLIVESDNDPLLPAPVRAAMAACYPSTPVATLRGGGHFPYLSAPAAYDAVIEDFLAPLAGGAARTGTPPPPPPR